MTAEEIGWLIAHWDPDGAMERGLVGLRGPTLAHWIEEARDRLAMGNKDQVEALVGKIERLLEGKMPLSAAAVVECGCLHTS